MTDRVTTIDFIVADKLYVVNTKKKRDFKHAQERCLTRYGIKIKEKIYLEMCELISNKKNSGKIKVKFLKTLSNTRRVYLVRYKNKNMIAVWSNASSSIVTFLPEDAEY